MAANKEVNGSRRNLLKGAALATVAGTLAGAPLAHAASTKKPANSLNKAPSESRYWLTNLLLETGFEYNHKQQVEKTLTGKFNILINNGSIEKISQSAPKDGLPHYDMKGALASPSFANMHMHIDKSNYAMPWKAPTPIANIQERIDEERQVLPGKLATATDQAKALLALMTDLGTTHFRIQCNVDPVTGTQNIGKVRAALESYKDEISYEMVAFPQHGTLTPGVVDLLDKAMGEGCTLLGGVDPATIDKDVDKSLSAIFDLAVKHNQAGIDIHIHNMGQVGADTISRICYFTEQAKLQGKVAVSHAFALGSVTDGALEKVLNEIASAKLEIISTVPIGGAMPSPMDLAKKDIPLWLGQDSINDIWSPFGTGNMLERVSLMAQRFRWIDEYRLNRSLKYITQGVMPLDDQGKQIWPKAGDKADLVFTHASCTAEMVARRNPVVASFKAGKNVVWKI